MYKHFFKRLIDLVLSALALMILAFSPIASAAPAFTAELKGDVGLASALNSVSILCSIAIILAILVIML